MSAYISVLDNLLLKWERGRDTGCHCGMTVDIAISEVEAAMDDIQAAGYDCFKTSLGGLGVTTSVAADFTHTAPS